MYGTFDIASLKILQKEFLILAFAWHPANYDVRGAIELHHYRLFEMGLNGSHFDMLMFHFVEALRDSWAGQDVIDDAVALLEPFRIVFAHGESEQETRHQTDRKTLTAYKRMRNHVKSVGRLIQRMGIDSTNGFQK